MRLGKVEFSRDLSPVAEDPRHYASRLAELARILHGVPWMLAGGLAVPVTLGSFYRQHFDVDIAFPLDAFPHIEHAMSQGGYYLSTYFPVSLFGTARSALHVPVSSTGALARRRTRKLKFRDGSGRRPPPNLLAVIEALPFRVVDDWFVTCDGRHRLKLDRPLVGHRMQTSDGNEVPCLDLHYVSRMKKLKSEPKHWLDLAVINEARFAAKSYRYDSSSYSRKSRASSQVT